MILIFSSFIAGMLSVVAPCVIIFMPVLLSRSATNKRRPWIVLASLAASVFIFSIALKSSTSLVEVPQSYWSFLSGSIILLFGLTSIFPNAWEKISSRLGLMLRAQSKFAKANSKDGVWGDILVGASLGPIFSACSPTYALIVATIIPADPATGLVYLLSYIAGLVLLLSLLAVFGGRFISKLKWASNPHGKFHKLFGAVLVVVGVLLATGQDKNVLTWLVENGLFDWQINLESRISAS